MERTRKDAVAILLALMMTATALSGCSGTDQDDGQSDGEELEDWGVYLAQSESDLPPCDSNTDGRLYYLSSDSGFRACSGGSWTGIDLTGPAGSDGATGPAGPAGADGATGPAGPAGADGATGPAGADGTSFTIVGTVEVTSDLGDVYIGDTGDAFMVNSTVHIHVWSGSEWIDLGNISGPAGPPGQTGPQGDPGEDGPAGPPGDSGASGEDGEDGSDGSDGSMPTVMEMTVAVSSMKFYIDGLLQPEVGLYRGFTYTFDQSSSTNSPHPFRLSTTEDGTHGGGSQYTDGVTYTGTQGNNGLMTFTVPLDAPDNLYYYCQNHANMGGAVQILSLGYVSS